MLGLLRGRRKIKPARREERKMMSFSGLSLARQRGKERRWFRWGERLRVSVSCCGEEKKSKAQGGLELAAGVGSKGRNLQKLGENAGFLADFGPDFFFSQVFNRDYIYRRCKRAILSILGKIFSP